MLGDNQNSVTDLVGDSGSLYEHIDYSPFGVQDVEVNNLPSGYVLPFGYTGTYTDPLTNLQLHGARWYDPASQRWLSEDPSGLSAGPNPYEYCGNAPTDGTDPSGEADQPQAWPPPRYSATTVTSGLKNSGVTTSYSYLAYGWSSGELNASSASLQAAPAPAEPEVRPRVEGISSRRTG